MFSKSVAVLPATLAANTLEIAAVKVVLPWSTCPMVPILQCGFVLSNLAFAILNILLKMMPLAGYSYYIRITRLTLII